MNTNDTAQLIYNKFKDKEFNNHYTVKHLYAELLKATAHTLDLPQLLPIADQFDSLANQSRNYQGPLYAPHPDLHTKE